MGGGDLNIPLETFLAISFSNDTDQRLDINKFNIRMHDKSTRTISTFVAEMMR